MSGILACHPDPSAILPKEDRNGYEGNCEKSKQRTSPVQTEVIEHRSGEQREGTTHATAHHVIPREHRTNVPNDRGQSLPIGQQFKVCT